MTRLDHHAHASRVKQRLYGLCNLARETLLNLQAAGKHVHQSGELAQSNHFSVRQISDVRLAEEWQHVMLAQTVKLDIANEHHLIVTIFEERVSHHIDGIYIVSIREELQALLHTSRRVKKSIPLGILSQGLKHHAGQLLERVLTLIQPTYLDERFRNRARSISIASSQLPGLVKRHTSSTVARLFLVSITTTRTS